MTSTKFTKGIYTTERVLELLTELGFRPEDGVGAMMGWWVSADGCTRFDWEDEYAMAFTLYHFQGSDRSCLDAKLTMSGRTTEEAFRAVVAGFGN